MGNLPGERIRPSRPFHTTGIDFCGPIHIYHKLRGSTSTKTYIAVFVCFSTKAVHLELVSDLSSLSFLNCLKRFISRRGLCAKIFCDNATNFVGARSELKELRELFNSQQLQSAVTQLCAENHIEWKPIPPRSPHFGGLWEAAVKTAKNHLLRQVGNAHLTYEELHTIVTQIEAIMNSRPLTPMSSDPNDLEALTPGHFLVGSPLTSFAEPDVSDENMGRLTRFQRLQNIQQNFWKRWSLEYIQELQAKQKWKKTEPDIQKGTLVLIKEQNMPPLKWPLGRVIETHEGSDKRTRVATIKTATGNLKRAVHNLCPLPIEESASNSNKVTQIHTDVSPSTTQPSVEDVCLSAENRNVEPPLKVPQSKPSRHPNKGKFLPIRQWGRLPSLESRGQDNNTTNESASKKEGEPIEAPRSKRQRASENSGLNTTLALLLLTSIIIPHSSQELVEVTEFTNHPGVFFEALGKVNLVTDEWNLIVFYDLKNYWTELHSLQQTMHRLEDLCHRKLVHGLCEQIVEQLRHQLSILQHNNELLVATTNQRPNQRNKRSPLDIVGTIANKLFGVLDQEYATRLEAIINNVRNNEEHLLALAKNQTSVIDSTLNIIKRDEDHINKQLTAFEKCLNKLLEDQQITNEVINEERIFQAFNSLAIHAHLIVTNYHKTQAALIDVLTDTHNGKLNPLILTPNQLKQELHNILKNLPPNTIVPQQYDESKLLQLYHLMTVKGRVTMTNVVFSIQLPLLNNEEYEIYHIVPVPTLQGSTYVSVQPETEYLVVSLHKDSYYSLTKEDLSSCITMDNSQYLCHQRQAIFNKDSETYQCEISLFNNGGQLSETCRTIRTKASPWWSRLHNPNHWLYSVPTETTINIVCDSKVLQRTLRREGILRLKSSCIIRQREIIINSHKAYSSEHNSSFVPSFNLNETSLNITRHEDRLNTITNKDIARLKEEVNYIKSRESLPRTISTHDIHHYTVGNLALIIEIVGIII